MRKLSTLFLALFLAAGNLSGQEPANTETVTFRFVPGKDMFYTPWGGNGAELKRLYALIDAYRAEITGGEMPIRVDGYCASLPTQKENRRIAFIRSNRVKSEMITRKGLKEEHFRTTNRTESFEGQRDVVIVSLCIPVKAEPQPAEPAPAPEPAPEPQSPEPPAPVAEPAPAPEPVVEAGPAPAERKRSVCLAVRTNLLYDAMLLPTLGLEWRVNRHVGIKLDGSRSWWGDKTGKVQKIWLLNPEVRWYLLREKRFYAGVSANVGKFNVYKYAIGAIASKDKGYQGSLWGLGLTVGYQLPLAKRLALDFNLGLGYTRFEYDTFRIHDKNRISKGRDCTKNCWGPTQAGVSLVWSFGKIR